MFIHDMDRRYEVLQKIKATNALDLYVAKDLNDAEQKKYTVVCIKDRELARKLIPITTKKNTSIAFKDLHESFNLDGKYYTVFQYAQGETLQQALQRNSYSLEERLLLMKHILEQIFLLNMPECFIYEILRKDNIVVDQELGIRFNYFFTEVDYYWQVSAKDCLRRISGLVQELFRWELEEKSVLELTDFARDLEQEWFQDIWECYEAYNEVYDIWSWKSKYQEVRPGRLWWKAWEAFKKKLPVIKAALTIGLIIGAGVYLLLNLPNPALSEEGLSFQKIGTLDIQTPTDSKVQTPDDTAVQTPSDSPDAWDFGDDADSSDTSGDTQDSEDSTEGLYPEGPDSNPYQNDTPNIRYPDGSTDGSYQNDTPNIRYPDGSTDGSYQNDTPNIRYPDGSTNGQDSNGGAGYPDPGSDTSIPNPGDGASVPEPGAAI